MLNQGINYIFYDGECGFCNKTIQYVLKYRTHNDYNFIPLQSTKAQTILKKYNITISLETFYLIKNNKLYAKSSAAIQVSKSLKFPVKLAVSFIIIPKIIRDKVYDLIAKKRHLLNKGFCVSPSDKEKQMFKF